MILSRPKTETTYWQRSRPYRPLQPAIQRRDIPFGHQFLLPPDKPATQDAHYERSKSIIRSLLTQSPRFLLHGTNTNNQSLTAYADFFDSLKSAQPTYRSCMPEIRNGTGINQPTASHLDTARNLTEREMGEFRIQLIHRNLQSLAGLAEALKHTSNPVTKQTLIGDYFKILPPWQAILSPVIEQNLMTPLLTGPVTGLVKQSVTALRQEALKLSPTPPEWIDTHWFETEANRLEIPIDWNAGPSEKHPNTVRPRIVTLNQIGQIEIHLQNLEQSLAKQIEAILSIQAPPDTPKDVIEASTRQTTWKLLQPIAPAFITLGHSQGGTVLMATLLAPNPGKKVPFVQQIAQRMIGVVMGLSAPLRGLPKQPQWVRNLLKQNGLSKQQNQAIADYLWKLGEQAYPATPEVREKSPLMESFRSQIGTLKQQNKTVFALGDKRDPKVEPRAAVLAESHRTHNVFNVITELPEVSKDYNNSTLFLKGAFEPWQALQGPWLTHMQMAFWKTVLPHMDQHWATAIYPRQLLLNNLENTLLMPTKNLNKLLMLDNYEPLRALALQHLERMIHIQTTKANSTDQLVESLRQFHRQHNGLLKALANNAQEWVPIQQSASSQAIGVLTDLLKSLAHKTQTDTHLSKENSRFLGQWLYSLARTPMVTGALLQESLKVIGQQLDKIVTIGPTGLW